MNPIEKINLIKKIRKFLADNQIDYLLVNSTNEFLAEYAPLSENSVYFLTNFSGSSGDALISQKNIFLFTDGRYHEQAEIETDKKNVTVVKMKTGESFSKLIGEKIRPNKTLAIISTKNSQGRLEILQSALKNKNIEIKLLDFDPIIKEAGSKTPQAGNRNIEKIDVKITGRSSEQKIKKISKRLKQDEAILISSPEEVSYLLNIRDFSKPYSSAVSGIKCLISQDGYIEVNLEKLPKNIHTIYVDKTSVTAYEFSLLGSKAVPVQTSYIQEMKAVKTNEEIIHLKKCFERADKALNETRDYIEKNQNISECDISKKLEENFYKFGARSLSFKSIVAKDKNSALAHYSKCSKDEILEEGSLILIDCGAYYEGGYATDCTRVFVKGEPNKLQKKIYTLVLKGFLAAFNKKITAKISGFELDRTARKILIKDAPKGFDFYHSLGHGIGICVHESPPRLSPSLSAKAPIKPNMCFTIEPGLYKKGFGGVRLENSCWLKKEEGQLKIKSFSNMCFEEKLIDFALLTMKEKKWLKSFEVK